MVKMFEMPKGKFWRWREIFTLWPTRRMPWNLMFHCVRLLYDERRPWSRTTMFIQSAFSKTILPENVVDARTVEWNHGQWQTRSNYDVEEGKQSIRKRIVIGIRKKWSYLFCFDEISHRSIIVHTANIESCTCSFATQSKLRTLFDEFKSRWSIYLEINHNSVSSCWLRYVSIPPHITFGIQ